MYVIYPLICYNAAQGLFFSRQILTRFLLKTLKLKPQSNKFISNSIYFSVFAVYVVLSIARVLAQLRGFTATMSIYTQIDTPSTICFGKEWYRFPSSFFLPHGSRGAFVKSSFEGLLPGQFAESNGDGWRSGIWRVPPGMNDQNLEEVSHMVTNLLLVGLSCRYLLIHAITSLIRIFRCDFRRRRVWLTLLSRGMHRCRRLGLGLSVLGFWMCKTVVFWEGRFGYLCRAWIRRLGVNSIC
jgi:Alg9-like mannosyltransferase family